MSRKARDAAADRFAEDARVGARGPARRQGVVADEELRRRVGAGRAPTAQDLEEARALHAAVLLLQLRRVVARAARGVRFEGAGGWTYRMAAARPADETVAQAAGVCTMVTAKEEPALGICNHLSSPVVVGGLAGHGLLSRPHGHSNGASSATANAKAAAKRWAARIAAEQNYHRRSATLPKAMQLRSTPGSVRTPRR